MIRRHRFPPLRRLPARQSYVDVLIPAFERPSALAVTLAGIAAQSHRPLRVLVSDQTEDERPAIRTPEVEALARVLDARGIPTELHRHLPPRGMAEQRAWLLARARAPYVLFLDADVLIEPDLVGRLVGAIRSARCGFVGSGLIGLSHRDDVRPHEQRIEPWGGPVRPERVLPDGAAWQRHRLHNAANLQHLRKRREPIRDGRDGRELVAGDCLYRVAWVGGCVLYDAAALRAVGGFGFWRRLPPRHAGEDVLAQLRVMARFGGAGLFPSGAYHLELPTTIAERPVDAPRVLPVPRAVRRPAGSPATARRAHASWARRCPSTTASTSSSR